ncbi:MAG: hypothetical protein AVO35_09085 [Candidatus Aegiribacteria sp. MLS_C]|nr:MAG: hypothetical protein AVO35_09085 [Candidatus Aegiribacteria sp. MLS_C]
MEDHPFREGNAVEGGCPGSIIPSERRSAIFNELLEMKKTCETKVVVDNRDDDDLVLVGVGAVDWPGLATVVLSELHHSGWNLDLLEGFALESDGIRRGFVITGIRDDDSGRRDAFVRDAEKMANLLENLAKGRAGTVSLLSRAAERLEKFEEVREALETQFENGFVPPGILGEQGELVLFISSRSDEYLAERKASDLAWIIKTNFQLVNQVRSSSGKPQFAIKNLRTSREHLTGINIAGFERDISFQNCVTALTHAWYGASIRHQRRYTTRDGIISIRIEMTGPTGLSATRAEQTVIKRSLKKLLVSHELEKLKRVYRYGGGEHYARALIPLLIKESQTTGMNQAYIAVISSTTFEAQLKLVLVTSQPESATHDNKIIDLVGRVNGIKGLSVVSFRSPSNYSDVWVDILNITAEREDFAEMEDAYRGIKLAIEGAFGQFRDFDRGMRLNDVRQLAEIRDRLVEIPDNVITDFYYHIEDFLRASVSVEELAQHIKLVYDSISGFMGSRGASGLPDSLQVMEDGRNVATLICMVSDSDTLGFQHLLEAVKEYKVNISVIEWSGVSAILFRLQKEDRGLPEEDVSNIVKRLSKEAGDHP